MISSLELARRCGVSQGTVDRALHGRPGISMKTREKILRAARQGGYRPHPGVRELLTGQSRTVAALVPSVNNIFFMDLFSELDQALKKEGLRLQLSPVEDRTSFLEALEDGAARRHRMVIAIPPEDHIPIPKTIAVAFPLVSLLSPCRGTGVHFLSVDEEQTGRDAVTYLHEQGHRRILHLTYARRAHAITERSLGYRNEMKTRGLKPHVLVEVDQPSLAKALEQHQPTALFCHNDWMALRTMLLLSEMGVRVPEDISVLGVDNSPTLMALHPGLTTLAFPLASAVRAVLAILAGKPGSLSAERYRVVERTTVRRLR